MCNLYTQTTTQEAMRRLFADQGQWDDLAGNLPPGDVYPDRLGPILHGDGGGMVLQMARWGLPSPPQYHSPSGIDRGATNVRNTGSPHWRRWLGPEHRCLVPMTRFAEPRQGKGAGNAWFAPTDGTTAFFAGLWVPEWTSVRKLKDGESTDDLYAFLTTEPNVTVAPIHPKAMPVILTERDEWETWLHAPWEVAKLLQRPLREELLRVMPDDGPV